MSDSKQIVNHVEKLALLEISPEEKDRFSEQIGKILKFVEKLNELDTTKIKPTSHILPVQNVTRRDSPVPSISRENVIKLAPEANNEFYIVPPVIQEFQEA
ncbi:MAG: Asp-tRNA(Asn)/Glu-tRNA(Gln) amidotransferase subunit GatC [Candidatus Aureabacteria bacterium]|nr:Asp-tRNA(Asn)/Glu-tRNA(Gln) amidotransferase subunit GatC [Candidatus Auribacterota bacterium]